MGGVDGGGAVMGEEEQGGGVMGAGGVLLLEAVMEEGEARTIRGRKNGGCSEGKVKLRCPGVEKRGWRGSSM